MEKKVTLNGSCSEGGFYATAIFTAKDVAKEKMSLGEVVGRLEEFFGDVDCGITNARRRLSLEVLDNRIILHIAYESSASSDDATWDDRVTRDANNLVAQLEIRLSHIE